MIQETQLRIWQGKYFCATPERIHVGSKDPQMERELVMGWTWKAINYLGSRRRGTEAVLIKHPFTVFCLYSLLLVGFNKEGSHKVQLHTINT